MLKSISNADIVCITETWLDELMPDSLVHIPGFVCFRRDRPSGLRGGGVCVYLNEKIPCKLLHEYEDTSIESIWITATPRKLVRAVSNLLIGVIYHPQSYGAEENQHLLLHLQEITDCHLRKHPDGLVM